LLLGAASSIPKPVDRVAAAEEQQYLFFFPLPAPPSWPRASSSPSARRQSRPRPTSSAMAAAAGSSGQIRPFPSWIRPVGGRISAMAARHRPSRLGVAVPVRLVVSIPAASRGLIPAARRGLILAASRGSSLSPASCPRVVARQRTSSAPPSRFGAPPLLCSSIHHGYVWLLCLPDGKLTGLAASRPNTSLHLSLNYAFVLACILSSSFHLLLVLLLAVYAACLVS